MTRGEEEAGRTVCRGEPAWGSLHGKRGRNVGGSEVREVTVK